MTESIAIQLASSGQSSIRLVFEPIADRWSHSWSSVLDRVELPFLTSVEGAPDQDWPASPPLQEISQHTLESGDAVLGVGMAGQSHWSASYSIEKPNQSEAGTMIQSDLACLQKDFSPQAAILGSCYGIDPLCQVQSFTVDRIEFLTSTQIVIVLEAMSGDDFKTVFELTDQVLHIRPSQISKSPVIATRWGFRVQISS